MGARFSVVYPTRHRPEFIRQALAILETQRHDDFEVIICDNYLDPELSCEQVCRESTLVNLRYVRPPQPLGMVENWNHALPFAAGEYVCYLTDKMFVLPDALTHIEQAIDAAGGPDIVSWTSDFYFPTSYPDYFGDGRYGRVRSSVRGLFRPYSPADELDMRGAARQSRTEQSPADYGRGKLVFGAYRRELVERIVDRYGALFHNINPDYTSMVLALTEAHNAIEHSASCVVSVNTDVSNGMLCDTSDAAALGFLSSIAGGVASVLPNMLVPGLYASLHNWVAHDYLTLKRAYGLDFGFNVANWLVYCHEDIHRPERRWSDPQVEVEQKGLLRAFVESQQPNVVATFEARLAARAAPAKRPPLRRLLGHVVPQSLRRPTPSISPSIQAAVERIAAGGN
ncbi:MAG: glycosyltransferase family 2 protein [Candidatus Limnocylindria bacterium]